MYFANKTALFEEFRASIFPGNKGTKNTTDPDLISMSSAWENER